MPDLPSIPEGLDVIPATDGVMVRKLWLTWEVAPLGLFAIFWGFLLFNLYPQRLSQPNPRLEDILFAIVHVAVGVGITYYVLASLMNKTDVLVSSSCVTVVIGPAPWTGNKVVKADDITEVRVRERRGSKGGRTYDVMYADRSREENKLVGSLRVSDQAVFIAVVIRRTLQIEPRT